MDKLYQDYAQTMMDTGGKLRSTSVNTGRASVQAINTLFQNPESNYSQIGNHLNALYKENGTIAGIVRYLQTHIPFNHYIFPTANEKTAFEVKGDLKEYVQVANFVDSYRVKFHAPYFLKQTLINGVSYFYKISNAKGVAYMEFPPEMCRIYSLSDGVYRWEVDIAKLSGAVGLPNELQKAIEDGAPTGDLDGNKKWSPDGKYFRVSDKGVAFSLDPSVMGAGTTTSELSSVLIDAIRVKQEKDNVELKDTLDTVKVIHSRIPINKDTGIPQMPAKTAKVYDTALKRSLPKGIVGITSPLEINAVNMHGGGNSKVYESLNKAQEQLFLSSSTPSNLFGGNTTSSNIVKLSVQKDASWLYAKVLPLLESYYNYELMKYKAESGMVWKIGFVKQSNYTMKDDIQITEKQLQQGGSRLVYLASTGLTPVEIYGLLIAEQHMLDIDAIMVPKATSFNTSGSDSGTNGRPVTDNPTDDTERINDAN